MKRMFWVIFFGLIVMYYPVYALSCDMTFTPEGGAAPLKIVFTITMDASHKSSKIHNSKWDFDDGETSTIPYPFLKSHIYTCQGTYHPTYRVETDQGTFECTALVIVKAPPVMEVSLEATTPQSGTIPFDVSFKANVENGTPPFQYVWNFDDGTTLVPQTENIQSHQYLTSGVFNVSVKVIDSLKNESSSNSLQIFVNKDHRIAIDLEVDPYSGFEGLTSNFYAVVTNGIAPYIYYFDFGDGHTQSGKSPRAAHTYTDAGAYTALVSVVDGNGSRGSVTHNITVVKILDNDKISSDFSAIISQTSGADSPEKLQALLEEGKDITDRALAPLHNASEAQRKLIMQTVRNKTENLINEVNTRLGYFENQGQVSFESVDAVRDRVSGLITTMALNNVALTSRAVQDTASISGRLFNLKIKDILKESGLSPDKIKELLADNEQLKAFLASSPEIFNKIYMASVVAVGVNRSPDRTAVEEALKSFGLSTDFLQKLQGAIPKTTDLTKNISESADGQQTESILDVFLAMLNSNPTLDGLLNSSSASSKPDYASFSSNGQSVSSSSVNPVSGNIKVAFQNMEQFSMGIPQFGVVSDKFSGGMHLLSDGSLAGLQDKFSFKIYPAPADPVSISAQIMKSFGMAPKFSDDGRLSVDYGDGIISLGMGWNINAPGLISGCDVQKNTFSDIRSNFLSRLQGKFASSIGTVGFTGTGGTDTAGYSYSILVQYGDGTTQLMPPMVMAENEILSILEALLPGTSSIDRNTGVLTIDQWHLKPDYLFAPLTEIDYTAIQKNNGFIYENSGFEFEDYNNDGQVDIKYYSHAPMGVQILYTAK